MGGSAKAPPPPDTSRFSNEQIKISARMQKMGADMWQRGMDMQKQINASAEQYIGSAFAAMDEQMDWGRSMRAYYDEQVVPQMDSLFKEADQYASKAEEQRQRGMAIQDVKVASEAQRKAQERHLVSFGLDPTDLRSQALDAQGRIGEAAASALAANQAGERTKQIGRELRTEAIGLGNPMLADAQQAYNSGGNLGISGVNAQTAATNTGTGALQAALPFYGGASQASATGAGIVDTSYGRELDYAADQRAADAADGAALAGIGKMAGMAANFIPGIGPVVSTATGAATGGAKGAEGGPVQAPGGPTDDAGALAISDGEYVVPADVVRRLGTNHFDKLIEKETGRPPPGVKQAIPIRSA